MMDLAIADGDLTSIDGGTMGYHVDINWIHNLGNT